MQDPAIDPRELNRVVHDLTPITNLLAETQDAMLTYLAGDATGDVMAVSDEEITALIAGSAGSLERAVKKAVYNVAGDISARNIPTEPWDRIKELAAELTAELALSNPAGTAKGPKDLRRLAVALRRELNGLNGARPKPRVNKEEFREVLLRAKEVERLVCILHLRRVNEMVKSLNRILDSFARTTTASLKEGEACCSVDTTLRETINMFRDIAEKRGIRIDLRGNSDGAMVSARMADLRTALVRLLDNAIKYTGELPPNSRYEAPWIEIRIIPSPEQVSVAFESWGVPITEEEKRGGFVFKEGYRGWFARQALIDGTGSGLAHVHDFAVRAGGTILFDSPAVEKTRKAHTFTKTTVILTLPVAASNSH
jgi:signal transduction histidine kinase